MGTTGADTMSNLHRFPGRPKPVLITGGAGFLGSNLADRLASDGLPVLVFDSLERPGAERNLTWLKQRHGGLIAVSVADIRDEDAVDHAVRDAEAVFHLAAQASVAASLADPAADLAINAQGTLNVLEALRRRAEPPPLLFASTGMVYGAAGPSDRAPLMGCAEDAPLRPHTPFGCSMAAAEQYVLSYARSFELPAVVLRMGCVYGPRQFGSEDEGWIARFLSLALAGEPIPVHGDGHQAGDALYVEDAVDAWLGAWVGIEAVRGRAFNLGGGARNTLTQIELLEWIPGLTGRVPTAQFAGARPGDHLAQVLDTRALADAIGWQPRVDLPQGLGLFARWLADQVVLPAARRQGVPA